MPTEAVLRIARVAELTGVPEPTLRAWERRYGVPSPERTASGYRLYGASQVADVRRMRQLCEQGLAAAEAASVVREGRMGEDLARLGLVPAAGDPHEGGVAAILDAVQRFDDVALEEQMQRLGLLGSVATAIDRVLTPALHAVGERWSCGDMTVSQERMASQRIGSWLRKMMNLSRGEQSDDKVILASFADDEHECGLLATGVRFALWGMRPIYLGGKMPPESLATAIEAVSPRFVAFSVTTTPTTARARALCESYRAACRGVPWLVGGAGAAALGGEVRRSGAILAPTDVSALKTVVGGLGRVGSKSHRAARTRQGGAS